MSRSSTIRLNTSRPALNPGAPALVLCLLLSACSNQAPVETEAGVTALSAGGTNLLGEETLALTSQAAPTRPWVMGYYMGYLADRQRPSEIDWRGLTHLAMGFFVPRADGALEDGGAPTPQDRSALRSGARQSGRKLLATIGGENTGPLWAVAAGPNQARFVAALKQLVRTEKLDGLDLDWEPLEDKDQDKLLALVKALRQALPGKLLTFPAGGTENANFPADQRFYARLAPHLDQLNLMTYGMAGAYEGWQTWHSSALYGQTPQTPVSVDLTVQSYLKAGVPASKLGLGIGFYGLCYGAPASAPHQDTVGLRPGGAKLLAGDNNLSYANIVTQYLPKGTRHWDSVARVPYLSFAAPTGPANCTYLSYEDAQSIAEKAKYLRQMKLGGAIIWNINEGHLRGANPANPLLDVIRRSFLEGR